MLTKIHIHPLLWIVMAFAVLSGQIKPLLCLLIIVCVHELGHAAAACYYHWRIRRIFLLPFGGTVEVEEHGNRPLKRRAGGHFVRAASACTAPAHGMAFHGGFSYFA
ncbi:hypothetical protein BsIDN1_48430 [Bacillus safensis]|uniref:Peptidase M50 domain-containing protein n=1 Tax=Bacillus safensis TaxID=561879 RepID=A0A5S9MEH2_BACIA|nr:hypothetical protein BsIDN1_48430 [Bacillus safensis]